MPGQAVYRGHGRLNRPFAVFWGQQTVADGGQQLIDVGQLNAVAGPHREVEVVVLGCQADAPAV